MDFPRLPVSLLAILATWSPPSAQFVISKHSGVVYFFEGSVCLDDQLLQQKFGKFPDIAEGGELRTADGRAEVLLTPGVILRIGDHSRNRLLSSTLADTRVELLEGSAILEATSPSKNTSALVIYKDWQVKVPQRGIYRIDTMPPQIRVYRGEAEVAAGKSEPVAVKAEQALPLASVLVAETSPSEISDAFDDWAIERSQAIDSDNTTAAQILVDPNVTDSAGLALGGLSYFPMTSLPSLGIAYPYGLSFWSSFQPSLNSLYFRNYGVGWAYPIYPGGLRFFRPVSPSPGHPYSPAPPGSVGGIHPGGGLPIRSTAPNRLAAVSAPHSHPAIGGHVGHR